LVTISAIITTQISRCENEGYTVLRDGNFKRGHEKKRERNLKCVQTHILRN
jgi:hypothetical protein